MIETGYIYNGEKFDSFYYMEKIKALKGFLSKPPYSGTVLYFDVSCVSHQLCQILSYDREGHYLETYEGYPKCWITKYIEFVDKLDKVINED